MMCWTHLSDGITKAKEERRKLKQACLLILVIVLGRDMERT